MQKTSLWFLIALFAVALVGCDALQDGDSATDSEQPTTISQPTPTQEVVNTAPQVNDAITDSPQPEAPANNAVVYNGPDWTNLRLVNAHSGQSFALSDFAGRTVLVEPMATWCTNCRAQQRNVREAIARLENPDDFVFISLSVENGLPQDVLAGYADRNGFDWLFTVGTNDMVSALVSQFGRTVVNPPATPHFTIAPDGTVSVLRTGYHSPDALVQEVQSVSRS